MGKLKKELEKKKKQLRDLKDEIKELEIELGTYKNPLPDLKGKIIKKSVSTITLTGTSWFRIIGDAEQIDWGYTGFYGIFITITEDKGNKRINIETNHYHIIDWEDWDNGEYSIVPRQEFDELLGNWLERNADILNRE